MIQILHEKVNTMFNEYSELIKKLKTFDKKDILNSNFELYNQNNMSIYYAPHNETINNEAKIFIVGITPGWTQTQIAYKTANKLLLENKDYEEIKRTCKKESRFAGTMRKNIIEMLDELELNKILGLKSCSELFTEKDYLLHTTSIIPYPVFINGKNYTGHTPKILENNVLTTYTEKYFYQEIEVLKNSLIIPLGISVEEVLLDMIDKNIIKKEQCLLGFPHPSGANGHRKKQFTENKLNLKEIISNYFIEYKIMNLMNDINYGWIDSNNQKHFAVDETFSDIYKLQSPKEVINNKVGVCWDQVELERYYFKETAYNIKTYFLVHYDNDKCPTHTFLVYEKNNKYYWFEHAWQKYQGIHEYSDIKELLIDVRNKFITTELNNQYNEMNLVLREYEIPEPGLNVQEFYKHCEQGKMINNLFN